MSGRGALKNSSVEENAFTFNSTDRHRFVRLDRTWASSSMMNTMESGSLMVMSQRNVDVEDCAVGRSRHGLDGAAMGFNDRSADRQAHFHAIRLGRVEWLKELGHIRFGEAAPGVFDRKPDPFRSDASGTYDEFALSVRDIGHRVGCIVDQAE